MEKTGKKSPNSPLLEVQNWKEPNRPDRNDDLDDEDDNGSSGEKTVHAPFVSCRHICGCTKANYCCCVENNIRCESTCGCSPCSFTQIGGVIKWDQQPDG